MSEALFQDFLLSVEFKFYDFYMHQLIEASQQTYEVCYLYHPHLTNEETEADTVQVTCAANRCCPG